MVRFAALLLVATILCTGWSRAEPEAVRYDLKAMIEPAAGTVAVRGTILVAVEKEVPQVVFVLHRTFDVETLIINGKKAAFTYQSRAFSPFNPAARNVVVTLPPHSTQLQVKIAYRGLLEKLPEWGSAPDQKLAMDDQVNERMVELASYSSWYPQFSPFGQLFAVKLEVSLPKGWTAISAGAKTDMASRGVRNISHWSTPSTSDIVVAASPQFRRVDGGTPGKAIEIYHTQMPDSLIRKEVTELTATMAFFQNCLGETSLPGGTIRHAYTPKARGQGRAGIARPGLIVTSEGRVLEAIAQKPGYNLFQDVAHEIAHFWWHFGDGQGDWINEAFAEYFSALAVRDVVSQDQFAAVLERYRKIVRGLPPDAPSLAMVAGEGGNFTVRYYKGSLMLDDVRQVMGDAAFLQASREFFQTNKDRRIGTAAFRAFWHAHLGDNGARLDAWLDSAGGLPTGL